MLLFKQMKMKMVIELQWEVMKKWKYAVICKYTTNEDFSKNLSVIEDAVSWM